jgi:hypothetical protein
MFVLALPVVTVNPRPAIGPAEYPFATSSLAFINNCVLTIAPTAAPERYGLPVVDNVPVCVPNVDIPGSPLAVSCTDAPSHKWNVSGTTVNIGLLVIDT